MALIGNAAVFRNATTDATGDAVSGVTSVTWSRNRDLIDITALSDSTSRLRIAGLLDLSASLNLIWDASDTGQARFATYYESGATLYVRYLPDGSTGFKCPVLVESISYSTDVAGVVTATVSLKQNGAAGTV